MKLTTTLPNPKSTMIRYHGSFRQTHLCYTWAIRGDKGFFLALFRRLLVIMVHHLQHIDYPTYSFCLTGVVPEATRTQVPIFATAQMGDCVDIDTLPRGSF